MLLKPIVTSLVLMLSASISHAASDIDVIIDKAATGKHRSEKNIARNNYRHPVETLLFFGLQEDMTVIEIAPGGMWYTEVLAPVLKDKGRFIAAGADPDVKGLPGYQYRQTKDLEQRFAKEAVFSNAEIARFSPPQSMNLAEPDSVDMVLTFRNTHGWIRDGVVDQVYAKFFEVLKPGGVLGVVQHRGPSLSKDFDGYVTEAEVIKIAQKAGFVLDDFSEVNANPKDTKDYAKGVWTLPPSLTLRDTDREKYLAIGESDRMTLRFRKP